MRSPGSVTLRVMPPFWAIFFFFGSLRLYSPWNSPGQNTGASSLSLLQGIFPSQGLNSGLLNCRQMLYQLSHKGSPGLFSFCKVRS